MLVNSERASNNSYFASLSAYVADINPREIFKQIIDKINNFIEWVRSKMRIWNFASRIQSAEIRKEYHEESDRRSSIRKSRNGATVKSTLHGPRAGRSGESRRYQGFIGSGRSQLHSAKQHVCQESDGSGNRCISHVRRPSMVSSPARCRSEPACEFKTRSSAIRRDARLKSASRVDFYVEDRTFWGIVS